MQYNGPLFLFFTHSAFFFLFHTTRVSHEVFSVRLWNFFPADSLIDNKELLKLIFENTLAILFISHLLKNI
jgi:hypothetical protein